MSKPLNDLDRALKDNRARRARDTMRYRDLDNHLCMLCHAHGPDMRNMRLDCGYAVYEVVPEALDLSSMHAGRGTAAHYYLRICKTCRAGLLDHLGAWREERVAQRDTPKDPDGEPRDLDIEGMVPIRENGITRYITPQAWQARRDREDHAPLTRWEPS